MGLFSRKTKQVHPGPASKSLEQGVVSGGPDGPSTEMGLKEDPPPSKPVSAHPGRGLKRFRAAALKVRLVQSNRITRSRVTPFLTLLAFIDILLSVISMVGETWAVYNVSAASVGFPVDAASTNTVLMRFGARTVIGYASLDLRVTNNFGTTRTVPAVPFFFQGSYEAVCEAVAEGMRDLVATTQQTVAESADDLLASFASALEIEVDLRSKLAAPQRALCRSYPRLRALSTVNLLLIALSNLLSLLSMLWDIGGRRLFVYANRPWISPWLRLASLASHCANVGVYAGIFYTSIWGQELPTTATLGSSFFIACAAIAVSVLLKVVYYWEKQLIKRRKSTLPPPPITVKEMFELHGIITNKRLLRLVLSSIDTILFFAALAYDGFVSNGLLNNSMTNRIGVRYLTSGGANVAVTVLCHPQRGKKLGDGLQGTQDLFEASFVAPPPTQDAYVPSRCPQTFIHLAQAVFAGLVVSLFFSLVGVVVEGRHHYKCHTCHPVDRAYRDIPHKRFAVAAIICRIFHLFLLTGAVVCFAAVFFVRLVNVELLQGPRLFISWYMHAIGALISFANFCCILDAALHEHLYVTRVVAESEMAALKAKPPPPAPPPPPPPEPEKPLSRTNSVNSARATKSALKGPEARTARTARTARGDGPMIGISAPDFSAGDFLSTGVQFGAQAPPADLNVQVQPPSEDAYSQASDRHKSHRTHRSIRWGEEDEGGGSGGDAPRMPVFHVPGGMLGVPAGGLAPPDLGGGDDDADQTPARTRISIRSMRVDDIEPAMPSPAVTRRGPSKYAMFANMLGDSSLHAHRTRRPVDQDDEDEEEASDDDERHGPMKSLRVQTFDALEAVELSARKPSKYAQFASFLSAGQKDD